jgi:hypothetical protein
VATWPLIFVSSWIDLTGKAFGKGCGLGIGLGLHGLTSQIIGMITPCADADIEKTDPANTTPKITAIALRFMLLLPSNCFLRLVNACLTFKGTNSVASSCDKSVSLKRGFIENLKNVEIVGKSEFLERAS